MIVNGDNGPRRGRSVSGYSARDNFSMKKIFIRLRRRPRACPWGSIWVCGIILLIAPPALAGWPITEDQAAESQKEDVNKPHKIDSSEAAFTYMQYPDYYNDMILFSAVPDDARYRMSDLFIMRSDGTGLRDITNTPTLNEWGRFIGDGKIAYTECGYKGTKVIMKFYVMDVNGFSKRELTKPEYDALLAK